MARSRYSWAAAVAVALLALTAAPVAAAEVGALFSFAEAYATSLADSVAHAPAPDSTSAGVDTPSVTPAVVVEPEHRLGIGGRAKRAASSFLSDGWVVVSAPFRMRGRTLVWVGALIGAEAVLYRNDQAIYDASLRNESDPAFDAILDVGYALEPLGFMGRTYPYYLAAMGAGYAFRVPVLRAMSIQILESHLLAGGIRNVGKFLVGREHPYEHHGPYTFRFGHATSFPSGHTSVVYELATIASMNADLWPVTVASYAAATTVAIQRVHSGNHWASDVLISAVYGTLVSRMVVKNYESRLAGRETKVSLMPEFSQEGQLMGVRLTRSF